MPFFEKGYVVPKSESKYMKLKDGDNLIRILGAVTMGWLDWEDRKPIRTPYAGMESKPKALNPKKPVKHFWAFPVWNYQAEIGKNSEGKEVYIGKIQILEVTQATIQDAIYNYHLDADFGDPTGYDIKITRSGQDLETKYAVVAKPPKAVTSEIAELWKNTKVDCKKLLTNEDPFEVDEKEIDADNIPF